MTLSAIFLHGLMQNAKMMANDFSSMKNKLSKLVNINYLDAPHFLDTVPAFLQFSSDKSDEELREMEEKFRENHYKRKGKKDNYERTWFFTDRIGNYSPQMRNVKVLGLEESMDFVLDECKKTNCDGLIGFSQGSVVSSLLAKKTLTDPSLGWKPKFLLLFSAAFPSSYQLGEVLRTEPKMELPSLHVLGRNDTVVPNKRSLQLIDCFVNPVVHYHDGSHTVPDNDDLSVYENFFLNLVK